MIEPKRITAGVTKSLLKTASRNANPKPPIEDASLPAWPLDPRAG
jgi:hypothetical protein